MGLAKVIHPADAVVAENIKQWHYEYSKLTSHRVECAFCMKTITLRKKGGVTYDMCESCKDRHFGRRIKKDSNTGIMYFSRNP